MFLKTANYPLVLEPIYEQSHPIWEEFSPFHYDIPIRINVMFHQVPIVRAG